MTVEQILCFFIQYLEAKQTFGCLYKGNTQRSQFSNTLFGRCAVPL